MKRALGRVFIITLLSVLFAHSSAAQDNGAADIPLPPEPAFSLPEAVEGQTAGVVINAANAKNYKSLIISELYPLVRANLLELDGVKTLKYTPISLFGTSAIKEEEPSIGNNGTLEAIPQAKFRKMICQQQK